MKKIVLTSHSSIIFDLMGVLFQINKFRVLKKIGLFDTMRYLITQRKNPVTGCLELLDILAHKEGPTDKNIRYKNYLQPRCVTDWILGLKTSQETVDLIKQKIQALDQNFFSSEADKRLMFRICDALFDAHQLSENSDLNQKLFELIKKLKERNSYKLFLLTNIDSQTFAMLTQVHEKLFSCFDGIVTSCDAHLMKPQPDIYHHLLKTYNLEPQQCVFIDDQQENIIAAQKVGITGIHYKNFGDTQELLAKLGSVDISS